ncbi:MAG: phosphoenolpyruvate carboxylase, partial [Bdellovibrionales bacterium]|nr:phosphoenolpyruvate carboxylase [Bdellovibrionales bacterium]
FTSGGFFHNHNPNKGKTLYGAEVMVDPELRGKGIGKMLYQGRKQIVEKYGLKRIRAGARLRGYSKFQEKLNPAEYVKQVVEKKIYDPTLSFQLNQDFKVIDVAPNYLFNDPESLGYAAVIEWLNPSLVTQKDIDKQNRKIKTFLEDEKLVLEFLPRELRRLVRKATFTLGQIIREYEGDKFYRRVEYYREQLKKTRKTKSKDRLQTLLNDLQKESKTDRQKLAHAFSLQLELVNICEAAYRTWRLRHKPISQGVKSKLNLTYVLTAHPTEARSKLNVEILNKLEKLFIEAIHGNFLFNDDELSSKMRMIWLHPLSKVHTPTVLDEAEYMYSLIFSPDLFDFILSDKPSYDLKLRTWVGGDKDGHPYVNKDVMRDCLNRSRSYILTIVQLKIELVLYDLDKLKLTGKVRKSEVDGLKNLISDLKKMQIIKAGDGTRLKTWTMKYKSILKNASKLVKKHSQILLINRILQLFPAFVFPIELREDAGLIKDALKNSQSPIRAMLNELSKASGALDITSYARGLVISHCESSEDIDNACNLVYQVTKTKTLPIIPLFETKEALQHSKKILRAWFKTKKNHDLAVRHWNGKFETMLGYSDSSKQIGVLPSRYLIAKAMVEIEKVIKSVGIKPIFFHGSGGSVARGGGSLKEQIAWWPNSAIDNPKFTVQGEMIQRQFATKEILNSQCIHMANESRRRKIRSVQLDQSPELENFIHLVQNEYTKLVEDGPLLSKLLEATPYKYLDKLKIGSRPSKRPGNVVSLSALRAIPWVLCW